MSNAMSQHQRVAVVTGGSGGIGRAVAGRLAADGMSVVVNFAGNAQRADEIVYEISAAGGTTTAIGGDVADEHAMGGLFDEVERLFGGVDVVVHAAGRMDLAPLVDFDLETLDEMLRINVPGTFVVDQQAARRIRAGGSILNFSSSVLGRILPTYTGYAASKGAVEAMTFILAGTASKHSSPPTSAPSTTKSTSPTNESTPSSDSRRG